MTCTIADLKGPVAVWSTLVERTMKFWLIVDYDDQALASIQKLSEGVYHSSTASILQSIESRYHKKEIH